MSGSTSKDQVETWEQKIERARNRPPAEDWITIHDEPAVLAAAAALEVFKREYDTASAEIARECRLQDKPLPEPDALDARVRRRKAVKEALTASESAEQRAADLQITFHVRGLPPDVYDALEAEHPPTDEQEERGRRINVDTYLPALLAACSVQPLTEEQATGVIRGGNRGEAAAILNVLRAVNETGRVQVGKGFEPTRS